MISPDLALTSFLMSVSIAAAYPPAVARRYYFSTMKPGSTLNTSDDSAADPRRWLVLAITASGLLLICIDMTVLFVALPALTSALAATQFRTAVDTQRLSRWWSRDCCRVLGTLGDRYGHRRLFTLGLSSSA